MSMGIEISEEVTKTFRLKDSAQGTLTIGSNWFHVGGKSEVFRTSVQLSVS